MHNRDPVPNLKGLGYTPSGCVRLEHKNNGGDASKVMIQRLCHPSTRAVTLWMFPHGTTADFRETFTGLRFGSLSITAKVVTVTVTASYAATSREKTCLRARQWRCAVAPPEAHMLNRGLQVRCKLPDPPLPVSHGA